MQKKTKSQSIAKAVKTLSYASPLLIVPTSSIISPSTLVVPILVTKVLTTLGPIIEEILTHYFKSLWLAC